MNTMCFLLTIGLCILLTFSVSAQTPPHWGLTAFYTYEALNQQRPAWYAGSLSLQRQFARQTLIAELAVHQRFNRRDVAFSLRQLVCTLAWRLWQPALAAHAQRALSTYC